MATTNLQITIDTKMIEVARKACEALDRIHSIAKDGTRNTQAWMDVREIAETAARDCLAAVGLRPAGLSDMQRLAIACGNEPYADDKVCPTCSGKGHV